MEQDYKGNQSIDTVLANQIEAQQATSKKVLDWARLNLSQSESAGVRDTVITGRVEMRRIDTALHTNPAAAIFGESQVGKSYLVKNLLKNSDNKFSVSNPGSADVDFIRDLNPLGGGAESTSLITRFTVRPSQSPDPSYPVKVKLFSPTDLALIIADSFYSDVQNHTFPSPQKLAEEVDRIMDKYSGMNAQQSYITQEDIYEMSLYLEPARFPIARTWLENLHASGYFKRLATVIANVASSAWQEIFSILWNNNSILSDIFSRQIRLLHGLGFADTVFIDMTPLRNSDGTILSVDRIREFFGLTTDENGNQVQTASEPRMNVCTPGGVHNVKKSEFTSVTAEVVLEVPDDVASQKDFLRNLDILDFPGARSRENKDENAISIDFACNMVLRGRVAYLFNKYSRSYLITSLLFCYHDQQSNVKSLSVLLDHWIQDMVGDTSAERGRNLNPSDIPPLFIIGTKFNRDLNRNLNTEPVGAAPEALRPTADNRWYNRFDRFLVEILGGDLKSWFNDWTPGKAFDNLYLLRDYTWSVENFDGYVQTGSESGVKPGSESFLSLLRTSFVDYPAVQRHFRNPAEAWDRAASPNQDGSEYIIENLVKASRVAVGQRNRRFERLVGDNLIATYRAISAYYHDDDASTRIAATMRQAGRLSLIMDTLFSSRPEFFAEFLASLLVSEDKLHDKVLDVSTELKLLKDTDITPLLAIRQRAGVDSSLSDEENIRRILEVYHLPDVAAVDDYLRGEGFSIEDVLCPSAAKNLTQILVEEMERFWMHCYINPANLDRFRAYGLTDADLEALTGALKALYVNKLKLSEQIIARLRKYITTPDRLDDMADLIADLSAAFFNKFVNSFGAAFYTPELRAEVDRTAADEKIVLADKDSEGEWEHCEFNEKKSLDCMSRVFSTFERVDDVLNNPSGMASSLQYFSNYTSFRSWTDNMMRGFLASCDIPNYNVERNASLRRMLVDAFSSPALEVILRGVPAVADQLARMENADSTAQ